MKHIMTIALAAILLAACGTQTPVDDTMKLKDVNADKVELLAPDATGGSSVMEAFWQRRSDRAYSDEDLTLKELSNLLWAATGVNREDGRRTNPTAINMQEVSIYAFLPQAVYYYNHKDHTLEKKAEGDYRSLVGGRQEFVMGAPLSLVIVEDLTNIAGRDDDRMKTFAACDVGIVSQNINIFCAAYGLATVTRASMDQAAICTLLNLPEHQIPLLNNPVGKRL